MSPTTMIEKSIEIKNTVTFDSSTTKKFFGRLKVKHKEPVEIGNRQGSDLDGKDLRITLYLFSPRLSSTSTPK